MPDRTQRFYTEPFILRVKNMLFIWYIFTAVAHHRAYGSTEKWL